MAMTRQERIALHKKQERLQVKEGSPMIKDMTEGVPVLRSTVDGLTEYIRYKGILYKKVYERDIAGDAAIDVTLGKNPGDDFRIDNNKLVVEGDRARVGIGTNTPDTTLHLQTSGNNNCVLKVEADSVSGFGEDEHPSLLLAQDQDVVQFEITFDDDNGAVLHNKWNSNDADIHFKTKTDSTRMTILGSGEVGIGVVDPDTLLEIYKVGTQLKLSGGAADYATFAVAADGALTITTVDDTAASGDICLMPDGDVGIGTASPVYDLDIKSQTGADCIVRIDTTDADDATSDALLVFAEAGVNKWIIYSNGDASDRIQCVPTGAGVGCYIPQTGSVWLTLSDKRIKENIVDIDKGLNCILDMKPRRFNYKASHGGLEDIGFIAQELQSVLPEVVDGDESDYRIVDAKLDEDGNEIKPKQYNGLMGLSEQKIVPVLVKAVQELSAKVDLLETELQNIGGA